MYLLRKPILAMSESRTVRDLLTRAPVTRDVVQRFVAGEGTDQVTAAIKALRSKGLQATCDFLGEDTTSTAQADATVAAYLELIESLTSAGLVTGAEMSVKLSAVGQALPTGPDVPGGGPCYAATGARTIVQAAYAAGARVTLDMEDHTMVDSTLAILAGLRREFPDVGIAVQAMLLRTPEDLAALTGPGSRVRLVKGAYNEPESVAHTDPEQIDLAYVRALRLLMDGAGYPMVGTHDPRLIAIAEKLASDRGRGYDSWEYQMLYGIRPGEQARLAGRGHTVRVYVPYGHDWYGYFTRRLAERPANLMFFLRSFTSQK